MWVVWFKSYFLPPNQTLGEVLGYYLCKVLTDDHIAVQVLMTLCHNLMTECNIHKLPKNITLNICIDVFLTCNEPDYLY